MPAAAPDVSIIIVNYKTPQLVIDCLRSVCKHTQAVDVEVIIVDNESGDNSEAIVRAAFSKGQFPRLRWFAMGYNAGFGRANNFGMKQAQGRHLLLLNSDTLLIDDLISRCSQLLDKQADVAAVGAMQINRDGQIHRQLYTRFAQLRRFCYVLPEGWLHRIFPDKHYADPDEVDWIIGAFLMTRQPTIDRAGGFDERFFMYGEDVEWCHRLGQQGRMLVLHDGFFVHLEYGSDVGNATRKTTFINRFKTQMQVSNLFWIRKQYGAGAYLVLMLHYFTLVPIVYAWKIGVNIRQGKALFGELTNQRAFAQQVGIFSRFFWATLLNRNQFFKV